jgi:3-oxoacyl-[acyl-carrier protein] reductase
MDLGIKGKGALVMGGGRGIGRGIAEALVAEGVKVALVSRNQAALEKAASEMTAKHGASGGSAIAVPADLKEHATIKAAFEKASEAFGGIDILVNNSGGPPPSTASGVAPEVWRQQFEMMVLSVITLTDLALVPMRQRKWGRVMTVASSGVIQPIPTIGVSNTLRASLALWSKTVAGEVAADGVTVNMLLPGRIATERVDELDNLIAKRTGKTLDQIRGEARSTIPAGRYGTIEEFGAVAAFLASVNAGYVTGSMIRIDGGAIRAV